QQWRPHLALLVQVEPAAEKRVYFLTGDGGDGASVGIVVLRVHRSVGGREIHPRGGKARNGDPLEIVLLIGPDSHERDLVRRAAVSAPAVGALSRANLEKRPRGSLHRK